MTYLREVLRALAVVLAGITLASCATGTFPGTEKQSPPPRVGTWLHTDHEIAEWICEADRSVARSKRYVHANVEPSIWRQAVAHSSVVVLNNYIFAQPLPWTVFEEAQTYEDYLAALESFPPGSPENLWYRRLNEQLRTPLEGLSQAGDPINQKLIYIYAHMFGYDPEHAIEFGLTPLRKYAYAWPPMGLDGSWPESFLYDDDGDGAQRARPSFKQPATRTAMANAAYFFVKHFESVGARVHLSPWREVNGYSDTTVCPADDDARCGLDTWQDLYDTYDVIANRIASSDIDRARMAVYPTLQLESFEDVDRRCISPDVVNYVKKFYAINEKNALPFAIGISTYPSTQVNALGKYQTRLHSLLDNLDSSEPVDCDVNGDGIIEVNEGTFADSFIADILVPHATPLAVSETSRPPWLTFQALDTKSVTENERLGASMANTHLNYEYRAPDGSQAYPLEFVAFAVGPNWALPTSYDGVQLWITSASGISRYWLTPMQPLAGQLILDTALDADGDWDNDGVPNVTFGNVMYKPGIGLITRPTDFEALTYTLDNCPYLPNLPQSDADGDGIGDDCDNCVNVANYPQEDWDQDGFGSACDPDVNNDGLIQAEVDLAVVRQCQGAPIDCLAQLAFPDIPQGQSAPDLNGQAVLIADMDADEDVDADDLAAWERLAADASLRVSGFSCAGSAPCPDPSIVMLRNGETVTIPDTPPYPHTCTL